MPFGLKFLKSYWAALLWAAFILFICGVPSDQIPDVDFWAINIEDKIAHIGVFAILGGLMVLGHIRHHGAFKMEAKHIITFIAIGALYGVITEALQDLVFVSRYASFADLIADALGSIIGTVFAFLFFKNKRPR